MIDTSVQGLLFRFLVTLSGVIAAVFAMGLVMFATDTFCEDEGWHTFWDIVGTTTILLFVLQLAVKL